MSPKLIRKPLNGCFILLFALIALFLTFRVPAALYLYYAAFAIFAASRLSDRGFFVFLALASFAIRFAYIVVVDTPPVSDFEFLYDAAVLFSKGDYSFSQTQYFRQWGYQTGFVIYEGLAVGIFGEAHAVFALKALNCVWNTGITLLVYLLARNHFRESSARFASLMYMGLVFPITFVSVLSNQHISAFFITLGIFFLIDNRLLRMGQVPRSLAAGFFIALGDAMRPEGIIIIGSLAIYFVVLFAKAGKGRRGKVVLNASLLLALFIGLSFIFSRAVVAAGINDSGLGNENVYWKFVVGLNHESKGTYNAEDVTKVFRQGLSKEERIELEKSLIAERLRAGPARLGLLFLNKLRELWCDNALEWSYRHILERGTPVRVLCFWIEPEDIDAVLQGMQSLSTLAAMMLCLAGAVRMRKTGAAEAISVYLAILVISTAVYFLIEVQPRYVYLQQIFLFILSAAGCDLVSDRLESSGLKGNIKRFIGKKE
jgi:hypothetical protein